MTVPAPAPLVAGGGGGGGGLTAESDELILVDSGNANTPFIRRLEKDDAGLVTDFDDYALDGSTPYVFVGPAVPFSPTQTVYSDGSPLIVRPTNAGPASVVDYNRYVAADSPVTIAPNALRVHYVVIADGVAIEGEDVPAGVGVSHGFDGFRTDTLAITISGGGDVLVIEERAA